MAKLVYSAITSLDGYVEDRHGAFDWGRPDAEVHTFVNELERPVGTYLYGRRMYETMSFWERPPDVDDLAGYAQEYAEIWQQAQKIVYSTTLQTPATAIAQLTKWDKRRTDERTSPRLVAKSRSGAVPQNP
jgi:dihydrofolate reductase